MLILGQQSLKFTFACQPQTEVYRPARLLNDGAWIFTSQPFSDQMILSMNSPLQSLSMKPAALRHQGPFNAFQPAMGPVELAATRSRCNIAYWTLRRLLRLLWLKGIGIQTLPTRKPVLVAFTLSLVAVTAKQCRIIPGQICLAKRQQCEHERAFGPDSIPRTTRIFRAKAASVVK